MKRIYYQTNLKEIPKNCLECSFKLCNLPYTKKTFDPVLKNKYCKERHPACPLKENDKREE